MILPDLVLESRINQRWQYSGMDSLQECLDRDHFHNYPFTVEYVYNSRGFRDQEWPHDQQQLREAVWCIGDSFTVGLGQPLDHIWPAVTAKKLNRRTINISMDGASNQWISRRTQDILRIIKPKTIIIMWSHVHRRENPDATLSDEERRIYYSGSTSQQDIEDLESCLCLISDPEETQIISFIIPDGCGPEPEPCKLWQHLRGPDWPDQCPKNLQDLPKAVLFELEHKFHALSQIQQHQESLARHKNVLSILQKHDVNQVRCLDRARDGYHFDLLTARWIADRIADHISP